MIYKYKTDNKVYLVGETNSGKSTLVNKIIKNYTDSEDMITTSLMPSTTLDTIEIKLDDELMLVDTPGIINKNSIINYIDVKTIKKITPKNEIKPKTFQIKNHN